ncbi:predicted protein [Histoplasma capsulatum var. duboisii H88]|uniref:Predicted protein n=1 Tax=Ajellomyces capsulatus (strain H88) TaxID=544711 RepID=F0UAM2_AJEC8|nr:predicted protein [Histoplasma capsulatum var. duboisii H88]
MPEKSWYPLVSIPSWIIHTDSVRTSQGALSPPLKKYFENWFTNPNIIPISLQKTYVCSTFALYPCFVTASVPVVNEGAGQMLCDDRVWKCLNAEVRMDADFAESYSRLMLSCFDAVGTGWRQ